MRFSAFGLAVVVSLCTAFGLAACGASSDDPADGGTGEGGGGDGSTSDGPIGDGSPADDASNDGASNDASDAGTDADAGQDAGPPAVQLIGRFDTTDPAMPATAWPGGRIVARFNGTSATLTLTQTFDGFSGGPSWFNVIVDGTPQAPFSIDAAGSPIDHVVDGLAAGDHTIEFEKRTEAKNGTVKLVGLTFAGGTGLLPPPLRKNRRIEFIGESTIDGFGVEGTAATCGASAAPHEFDNVRKSITHFTATSLAAEAHVLGYSGKGVAINSFALDLDVMPILFGRALPIMMGGGGTPWTFANWTPDVVVISLGGVDYLNGVSAAPANFRTKYGEFIANIRTQYGASTHIFLTVWSQVKDLGGDFNQRTALTADLDALVTARQGVGDNKVYRYQFPVAAMTDETGCLSHANEAHHQAMANLLVTEIKSKTGW
ncbi:MAG: hypothetical protein KF819_23455 [Labilithrix sp.]|nr:hypothetical protein [Labilithrix sp.]